MLHDDDILKIATADHVVAKAEELYGNDLVTTGVIHVTAVIRRRDVYETLRIVPETPRCAHDTFVLNLMRARADAIVTTGKILREEPALTHRLQGPRQVPRALLDWRRQHLHKSRPPVTLVLTSGRDLDLDHPIFRAWTRPVIFTGREGQWLLESQASDCGVEIIGVEKPDVRGAIDCLRFEFGAATLSVEAGPSTSRQLYESPSVVDELLLSVAEVHDLPEGVRGDVFLNAEELGRVFSRLLPARRVRTADGEWSFQRFLK